MKVYKLWPPSIYLGRNVGFTFDYTCGDACSIWWIGFIAIAHWNNEPWYRGWDWWWEWD